MAYKLFLDDKRDPPGVGSDWVVARNYWEFIWAVTLKGMPEFISFDHDLGEPMDGKDCADWLVNYDLDHPGSMKNLTWYVHSDNGPGTDNINGLLNNYMEKTYGRS